MTKYLRRFMESIPSWIDSTLGWYAWYRKARGGKWRFVPNDYLRRDF